MAPLYPAGTLVAVEPIDASAVEAGMVIVFRDPLRADRLVAHRAVARIPGEQPLWQTKGDANRDADPWHVSASDVRGCSRVCVVVTGFDSAIGAHPSIVR